MPVNSQLNQPPTAIINDTSNVNRNVAPNGDFTINNNLLYFIVSIVIQTEFASNSNQNLTQKQITELFNVGTTIQQMYDLTVKAGYADNETFLNSIPLAYVPVSSSVLDEIINLRINNLVSYSELIQYVNAPGADCWAFGSVSIVADSISKATVLGASTFNLTYMVWDDTDGSDGNSLNSLWKLFNADNTLPSPYSSFTSNINNAPLTIENVQKSVQNFIALDNFLSESWGSNRTSQILFQMLVYQLKYYCAVIPI